MKVMTADFVGENMQPFFLDQSSNLFNDCCKRGMEYCESLSEHQIAQSSANKEKLMPGGTVSNRSSHLYIKDGMSVRTYVCTGLCKSNGRYYFRWLKPSSVSK